MMQIPTLTRDRPETPDAGRGYRVSKRWIFTIIVAFGIATVTSVLYLTHRSPPAPRSTPTSVPPAPPSNVSGRLQWAPPALSHPRTIRLSAKDRALDLDPKVDYRLVMPHHPITVAGGLSITGGHNVVLIGGTLNVPSTRQAPDAQLRRGIYLKGQTGVIHIEGLKLGGDLSEGFDLDERLGATVQIENVQVGMVHGSRDTNHADVVQTWAGPATLRIDGLRARSDYQGLFLLPNQRWSDGPTPRSFDIRRSVIVLAAAAGYGVWVPDQAPWFHANGLTIVTDKSDRAQVLWPASELARVDLAHPQSADDSTPSTTPVALPDGTPGVGYHSPGYRPKASP